MLIRHVGRFHDGPQTQFLKPIRHSAERAADTPTQRKQSYSDDQNGLDEDAGERAPPHGRGLQVDIGSVVE